MEYYVFEKMMWVLVIFLRKVKRAGYRLILLKLCIVICLHRKVEF